MKTTVELFGENREVTFNEEDVRPIEINNGETFEEAVIADDNTLIAYDEAVCAWVSLGTADQLGYSWKD